MAVKKDPTFQQNYNCLVSDLVGGFPPNGTYYDDGSKMYVWDDATKQLNSIYKKVFGVWYKL